MTPATMTTLPWAVDPGTDPRTGGTPDSGIGIGGPEPVGNADVRPMFGPAAVAELLATARTEVLAMSALAPNQGAFRLLGGHTVRPGVRFRALFPDSARTAPRLCRHLATLSLAGADIRTMPEVPLEALVVDRRVALLPASTTTGSVAALRLPGVVATARELFERLWPEAVPLADRDLPDDLELSPRERETLRLLAAGATDDMVAAHLGVAVRTVRRTVAVLMRKLGARSRFQAGVKAAGRGWLLEEAS